MDARQLKQQMQQATALFQAGRYDEAEVLLLEIIKHTPLYANIYNMLGFIYSQRNSPDKAVEVFRQALTINPRYTEARLNLAITLADMGAYSEALREYGLAREGEEARPRASPRMRRHAWLMPMPNWPRPIRGSVSIPRRSRSTRRPSAWRPFFPISIVI